MRAATLLLLVVSLAGCRSPHSHCTTDCSECKTVACESSFGCGAPCDGLGCVQYDSGGHSAVPPAPTPPAENIDGDNAPRDLPQDVPQAEPYDPPMAGRKPVRPPAPVSTDARSTRERLELVGGRVGVGPNGRIVEVDLSNSGVTDEDLRLLAPEMSLVELNLAGTSIGNVGLRNLPAIPTLRILDLTGTKVTGAGLGELRRLPGLEFVMLSNTNLGTAGIDALSGLSQLRGLDVDGANVTPKDVDRLRKALPECRVYSGEPDASIDVRGVEGLLSERLRDERFALEIADILAQRGDWDAVVEVLRPAADQADAGTEVRHRLAVALGRTGNLDAARAMFEQTVGPERARYNVALFEYEANLRSARRRMAETLGTTDLPQARIWLGRLDRLDRSESGQEFAAPRHRDGQSHEELPRVNLAVARGEQSTDDNFDGPTIHPRNVHAPLQPVPVANGPAPRRLELPSTETRPASRQTERPIERSTERAATPVAPVVTPTAIEQPRPAVDEIAPIKIESAERSKAPALPVEPPVHKTAEPFVTPAELPVDLFDSPAPSIDDVSATPARRSQPTIGTSTEKTLFPSVRDDIWQAAPVPAGLTPEPTLPTAGPSSESAPAWETSGE